MTEQPTSLNQGTTHDTSRATTGSEVRMPGHHLAVIEWDSNENPSVILGPDRHAVNLAVIDRITATLTPENITDAPTFLHDHPAPDPADPDAPALAVAWLEALSEAATVPWVTNYHLPDYPGDHTTGPTGAREADVCA